MLTFTEKVKFEKNDFVVTYSGVDSENRKFYAFIICNAKSYSQMRQDYESGTITPDIRTYGKVLHIDYNRQPDECQDLIKALLES